ncbi:Rrf2 family transcriptional regulator [Caenispirillum salinarum]|uniref:Rrf2 family transcriptional regulator n=1 Tax=Caenispirillum salinarum TaxID=859058 RepID=UPI00384B047C
MRLTQHTDFALRLLIALAVVERRAPGAGRTLTVRDIAERYNISRHHLMKVANELTRLGVVEGLRGRGGGVRLARPAAEIGIGAVVRALESRDDLVECFDRASDACAISPACRLKGMLGQAQEAFLAVLDRHTLADVVRRPDSLEALLGLGPEVRAD